MASHDTIGSARTAINLQCSINGNFSIEDGIGARKCDPRTHSGGVQKDNPFPTTWIGCWDDFELNSSVLHSLSKHQGASKLCQTPNAEEALQFIKNYQVFPRTAVL
jgi:hypothetical protein